MSTSRRERRFTPAFLSLLLLCCLLTLTHPAAAIETSARQALLLDYETGATLFEKAADERMYPASMTKIMTAWMTFSRLKNGALSLDDSFLVSQEAWRKGGSKMFLKVGDRVRVEDLLQGVIVQSGNDATITLAEGLEGSEEVFARAMTDQAKALGATGSHFMNASGWPDPEHYSTARDLAIIAAVLIRIFPEYYHFYSKTEFTYNGIRQRNRNPLIQNHYPGADGLKTGHTEASGYGLVGSAEQDGRRLIVVLNGLESDKARAAEAERLLTWGFREWERYPLFARGGSVGDIPVWFGQSAVVAGVLDRDVTLTLPRRDREGLRVTLRHRAFVPAPIQKGDVIGVLEIDAPGRATETVPVLSATTVERLGFFGRIGATLRSLIWESAP